jgi:hypothetical protein
MEMSKVYVGILELIIAIILGQNLLQVESIFIPFYNIFTERGSLDASALVLVYVFVISGWIGYQRSIYLHRHMGFFGDIRYGIDLAIVFFVYYLVSITNPKSQSLFGEAFIWLFPLIFGLYLLWDFVKIIEYRKSISKNVRKFRMIITMAFLGVFILQSFLYQFSIRDAKIPTPEEQFNKTDRDIYYIIISAVFVIAYRLFKWPIKEEIIEDKIQAKNS